MLLEAAKVVEQRRQTYGEAGTLMAAVAARWSIALGQPVTPAQVVLCLIDLKLARLGHDPAHADSILDVAGPLADHDLRGDELLAPPLCARPGYAQRPPGAQTGDQLAAQRSPALHVQRLIDRLVRDTHRLIIREVDAEPARDLLRAPRLRPPPILTATMTPTDEPHVGTSHRLTVGDRDRELLAEPVLRRVLAGLEVAGTVESRSHAAREAAGDRRRARGGGGTS